MKVNHYVYLLQSRINNMAYIGVRSCKGKVGEDAYMGSSKIMTKEDKLQCNKIILKRFSSRVEAVAYEIELHKDFDVVASPLFWNQAKQTSTGFDTAGRVMSIEEKKLRGSKQKERFNHNPHPCRGIKLTTEHKLKIGLSVSGKVHSSSTKAKMSLKALGTSNSAFTPWWYELNDVRTEVHTFTVAQVAEQWNVPIHCLKDRFRKQYEGKAKQTEPLKGIVVGRIIND